MHKIVLKKYKIIRVCFTGHRNIYGYNWESTGNKSVFQKILKTTEKFILTSGFDTFVFMTGGALLVDQMAATIIIHLRKKYKKRFRIILVIAVPYKDQPNIWKPKDQRRYYEHLKLADKVIYVDKVKGYTCNKISVGKHHIDKLNMRNVYMINMSNILIAVYDKKKIGSGTYKAIQLAEKKYMPIIYVNIHN